MDKTSMGPSYVATVEKPVHEMSNCWELHGRPSNMQNNRENAGNGNRRCWICNEKDHVARECPKKNRNNGETD